jgi:hypothetical protein
MNRLAASRLVTLARRSYLSRIAGAERDYWCRGAQHLRTMATSVA